MGKNFVEHLSLKDQLKHTLEEARVVLPGIQALFGFQLIAVFNESFSKQLTPGEQRLHLSALGLTAVSAALSMGTSALHRQSQPDGVSSRLVKLCTVLLTAGMFPLLIGISLDFYLMCRLILESERSAVYLACGLGTLLLLVWYIMPYALRRYLNEPHPAEPAEDEERPEFRIRAQSPAQPS